MSTTTEVAGPSIVTNPDQTAGSPDGNPVHAAAMAVRPEQAITPLASRMRQQLAPLAFKTVSLTESDSKLDTPNTAVQNPPPNRPRSLDEIRRRFEGSRGGDGGENNGGGTGGNGGNGGREREGREPTPEEGPEWWWPTKELGQQVWDSLETPAEKAKTTPEILGEMIWKNLAERPDFRAYKAMQYYQGLDWGKRTEEVSTKFKGAGDVLSYYAIDRKLNSEDQPKDPRISEIERGLRLLEEAELNKYQGDVRKQGELRMLLYELNELENQQRLVTTVQSSAQISRTLIVGRLAELNPELEELEGTQAKEGQAGKKGKLKELDEKIAALEATLNGAVNPELTKLKEERKNLSDQRKDVRENVAFYREQLFFDEAREARIRRLEALPVEIIQKNNQISAITGGEFTTNRTKKSKEVIAAVESKQEEIKEENKAAADLDSKTMNSLEDDIRKIKYVNDGEIPLLELSDFTDPTPEIKDIIEKLKIAATDPDPKERAKNELTLWDLGEVLDALPGLTDVTDQLREMRKLPLNEGNAIEANRLRRIIGWYTYHARVNGLLDGLDATLEEDDNTFSSRIILRGGRGGQESAKERDTIGDIKADFRRLTGKGGARYEAEADLDSISDRMGLPSEIASKFAGIRTYVLKRGYNRIRDRLNGLIEGNSNETVIDNQGDASDAVYLMGEWDIRKVNYLRARAQGGQEERPLYRRQYYVELLGQNDRDIEAGAIQYINDLLRGNNAYDLNTLLAETKALTLEIGNKGKLHGLSEARIMEIQDNITNKAYFRAIDFTGSILHMDVSFGAGLQWADGRGDARAKYIPQMENGLVGYALHLLKDPKYILYSRPEGWAGQMTNSQEGQRMLRAKAEEDMVDRLMTLALNPNVSRSSLSSCKTHDEFAAKFQVETFELQDADGNVVKGPNGEAKMVGILDIKREMKESKRVYDTLFGEIRAAREAGQKISISQLDLLRRAKAHYDWAKGIYEPRRQKAKDALNFAIEVSNVFGESAERGAPSLQTEKGDRIALPDITMALNFAVRMAAGRTQAEMRRSGIDTTNYALLIRQRALAAVTDYVNEIKQETISGANYTFKLQKGFEDTGLTESEFAAVLQAYKAIWKDGFNAQIEGVKLADILKMDELKPMTNNYLANDPHGKDVAFSKETREAVARGEQPYFASVYERLKWFGLADALKEKDSLEANAGRVRRDGNRATHEDTRRALVQVIENNRSLDSMLQKLTYYFATRKDITQVERAINNVNTRVEAQPEGDIMAILSNPKEKGKRTAEEIVTLEDQAAALREEYMKKAGRAGSIFRSGDVWDLNIYLDYTDFSDQNLVMEYPGPLGYKRFRNLKTRWFTRDDEFSGRGIEAVIWMPINWQDINTASGSHDTLETIWNIDREILDIWQMQLHFERGKDMLAIKGLSESEIDEKGKANWRFLDKPLSDPESLLRIEKRVNRILSILRNSADQDDKQPYSDAQYIEGLVEQFQKIFRDEDLLSVMARNLSANRGALDSGADWEEALKYRRRVHHQWLLSRKERPAGSLSRRGEGGLKGYDRVSRLIVAFLSKQTYIDGNSIESRVFEKSRPAVSRGVLRFSPRELSLVRAAA